MELRHPEDASNPTTVPVGNGSSNSRDSVGARGPSGTSRWRTHSRLFSLTSFRSSGQASPGSLGCPQIAPLDLGGDITLRFPSQIFFDESSSPHPARPVLLSESPPTTSRPDHVLAGSLNDAAPHQPTRSISTPSISNASGIPSSPAAFLGTPPSPPSSGSFSVLPVPSPVQSGYRSIHTRPHNSAHSQISSISNASTPLEVSLNIRNSIHLWSDDTCFIRKATMRGLVQYLLLNPAGGRSSH